MVAGGDGPGPFPRSDKRGEFMRLIKLGVPSSEACRRVGINRKTGFHWRVGRTIAISSGDTRRYLAVIMSEVREISQRFLTERERCLIADLRGGGATLRQIGDELGRSPSTISRELRRSTEPGAAAYRPSAAHRLAAARRSARRGRRVDRDGSLCAFIQEPAGGTAEPRTDRARAPRAVPRRTVAPWSRRASTRRSTTRRARSPETDHLPCGHGDIAVGRTAAVTAAARAGCRSRWRSSPLGRRP